MNDSPHPHSNQWSDEEVVRCPVQHVAKAKYNGMMGNLPPLELGFVKVNSDDSSVSSQSMVVPTILNKAIGSIHN